MNIITVLFAAGALLTNALELATALYEGRNGACFEITGLAVGDRQAKFSGVIQDVSGCVSVWVKRSVADKYGHPQTGERVRVRGGVERIDIDDHVFRASVDQVDHLSRGEQPEEPEVPIGELDDRCYLGCRVKVRGRVIDAFKDEIDTKSHCLVLDADGNRLCVFFSSETNCTAGIRALVGAEIRACGYFSHNSTGLRRFDGGILRIRGIPSIEVLSRPGDRFDVPVLEVPYRMDPQDIYRMGRRRIFGRVIAATDDARVLMDTESRGLVGVQLAEKRLPRYGDWIEAVGFAETDLYHINLSSAEWRSAAGGGDFAPGVAKDIDPSKIVTDVYYHGKTVKFRGRVGSTSGQPGSTCRFTVESGTFGMPVDCCLVPELAERFEEGALVEVTGVVYLDIPKWLPYSAFPHVNGIRLVLRVPRDLVVIRRPPWWTVGKLFLMVCSLVLALVGFVVWNRILNRLVTRRSRELMKEEISRAAAELRIDERTRLAVELHDSISQTLTGVSLQIDAAELARRRNSPKLADYLANARRTLESCREELRNCLWDLRNNSLECADIGNAIRTSLAACVNGAELKVDFEVPRSRLQDTTFHAVLMIVRELVVNAVRHGKAGCISVKGEIAEGRLVVTVRDDGTGFEIETCPGVSEGHFGLHGIRERVASLGGSFEIVSGSNSGTTARIFI